MIHKGKNKVLFDLSSEEVTLRGLKDGETRRKNIPGKRGLI